MSRRILAAAAMVGGLLVAAFAQSAAPVAGPPLYDGVVVVAPYVWLSPPPGLHGGARSDHETYPVSDGGFGAQTSEQPPQAEISVDFGSLQMPSGSKSVTITIRPVPGPGVAPSDGVLAGNVYRIEAVNQDGQAVEVKSGSQITILLRGPSSLLAAYIESYSNGQWTSLETDPVGVPDMYTALVGAFGDYAVVAADPNWQPIGEKARPAAPVPATPVPVAALPTDSLAPSGAVVTPSASTNSPTPAPTAVVLAATSPGRTGGSEAPGLPWPQVGAAVVGVLVVLAAGFVLTRPIKPPAS